nr:PREDICTED: leucine-rich repeat-containing protein 45 [Latimeria chalumnae]|eukprot:XP_014339989.1 PREDICTED: leucine-rich repeat-containing protein 45 [Latimeria chalumnae]
MEDFRITYVRLCKENGVEPQESVLSQLHNMRDAAGRTRLDLATQSLTVDTCAALGKALQNDVLLTEVVLSDCMLPEDGVKVLLLGLCSNTTAKLLDLKGNNMKAAGAEALGKLLRHNKSLRSLTLEWNGLGMWEEGFSILCDGLAANNFLKHLDLRNNQINHQGAGELAMALKHNSTLEELDLRWNNIGLLGGRVLLNSLQQNRTLVRLELAGNNIPSDVLTAVDQVIDHNLDRQSTQRENRSRTHILSKEIQSLKGEKNKQFLDMMDTIEKQRNEMNRSSRWDNHTFLYLGYSRSLSPIPVWVIPALSCSRLQMTEAALALSQQKSNDLADLVSRVQLEKSEMKERLAKELRMDKEEAAKRETKLLREINSLNEKNLLLKNKVDELERRCKSQQELIFELKQDMTNTTAELKLRLVQTEDHFESEKKRYKLLLDDTETLRQKEVDHMTRHLEESERALQERIQKLEGIRIHLEEELSHAKAASVTERAQSEEELIKVRNQIRLEEQQRLVHVEEKLRLLAQSRDESQRYCLQQKQMVAELQAKNSNLSLEMEGLQRRLEELQQKLNGKEQEKVAEVNKVRVEMQEQIGHLQAAMTAQDGLKEKIAALERQLKVQSSSHREALLDKESEIASLLEKLRLKDGEISRMREDETQRARILQNAVLAYVQASPLGALSPRK